MKIVDLAGNSDLNLLQWNDLAVSCSHPRHRCSREKWCPLKSCAPEPRMHESDVRRTPCNRPPPQAKILQSKPPPSGRKKIPLYLVLKGSKKISAPSTPKPPPPKPYIFVFFCVFMHYWTDCGPF